MPTIKLPTIELRDYQIPAWKAFEQGARRLGLVWPRRGGKDTVSLQMLSVAAMQRPGNYWHLFPEKETVRKAIWTGIASDGIGHIDRAFPPEIVERKNNAEMFIQLKGTGSTVQFGGSDRYNALVGTNPVGIVFSEFAVSNPRAYDFCRPILAENGGFAVFPYTPRGRNHGYELFGKLEADPQSFAEVLTCDDTHHITPAALDLEKAEMSPELFLQEYYASWDFGIEGAIYARHLNKVQVDGRICPVPYDSSLPVFCSLDIGLADSTALWFAQFGKGGQPRIIHSHSARGEQVAYYDDYVRGLDFPVREFWFPFDADQERLGQADTVQLQFEKMGWKTKLLPRERSLAPGIERCRVALAKAVFDDENTHDGRAALSTYHYEHDDKRNVFKSTPVHDWASDYADSFRYLFQGVHLGLASSDDWSPLDYSKADQAMRDNG